LEEAIRKRKQSLIIWTTISLVSYLLIIGFFYRSLHDKKKKLAADIIVLEKDLSKNIIELSFAKNDQVEKAWLNCIDAFNNLIRSERIWDVTHAKKVDRVKERSFASTAIDRKVISSPQRTIDFIKTDIPPLYLLNHNGPDIYIYPRFLVLFKSAQRFGIFDLKEVTVRFSLTNFVETEKVPSDSEIVNYTWAKVNKNGTRDKRFANNYEIPIVSYGNIEIQSGTGLDEYYMFSDAKEVLNFEQAYSSYLTTILGQSNDLEG
ncbi:MAG: hypothetical protein HC936_08055, partial [Leptolyngbyaceae cyanobacterium SU_3_3]|nr:hypothetical protein [Leptolyngbyaceae cyanobacterium SU_3_3]